MLDAFIIEQIRKRDRQEVDERPTIQLPLPSERERTDDDKGSRPSQDDEGQRGVIVIDFA